MKSMSKESNTKKEKKRISDTINILNFKEKF